MSTTSVVILIIGVGVLLALIVMFFHNWYQPRLKNRHASENALKHLHDYEVRGLSATAESLGGYLGVSRVNIDHVIADMERKNLIERQGHEILLTPRGRGHALWIVRSHRLWERYLADEVGLGLDKLHARADRREHDLDEQIVNALDDRLAFPRTDPHGDLIPTAQLELPPSHATPLSDCKVGDVVKVFHIEDDDPAVLKEILQHGIEPGVRLEVMDRTTESLKLKVNGADDELAPLVAEGISVEYLPAAETREDYVPLSTLRLGQTGTIARLACHGLTRRRFLDLGMVPGTKITAVMRSALGEPIAYRVRETVLVLRRGQADQILLESLDTERARTKEDEISPDHRAAR